MRQVLEASNFYEVLGVDANTSKEDINRAYRRLAGQVHPDKVGQAGHNAFLRLGRARDVLSNPKSRRMYDIQGEEGLPNTAGDDDDEDSFIESMFGAAMSVPLRQVGYVLVLLFVILGTHSYVSKPSVGTESFSLVKDQLYGWTYKFVEPTFGIEFFRSHSGPVPPEVLKDVVTRYTSLMTRRRVQIGPQAAEKEKQKIYQELLKEKKAGGHSKRN